LKIFGIVLASLGIITGAFFLKHMLGPKTNKLPIKQFKASSERDLFEKKQLEGKLSLAKKSLKSPKKGPFEAFAYKTNLSNFLIPLSDKEFLKVEIIIFFSKYEQVKEFKERELIYRKFFYDFLKKVPPAVWYDARKLQSISEKAVQELKKERIVPLPLEIKFDGAILKA
jgi:hypothetical protein